MASIDVAKLLNKITQDIPGINTVLKALAKWDVSALTDVPDGAMQATTDANNNLTIKKKVSGSYTPVAKLMHDVDKLDGYHASASATANAVAVRNAQGALPGNILGNSATADTAVALAAGSVVPVNQGGTGATTASQARANLGVADGADFTAHIAKQASPSVEGHVKLDALAADGSNTAAPGGFGIGLESSPLWEDYNSCLWTGYYRLTSPAKNGPIAGSPGLLTTKSNGGSNKLQEVIVLTSPARKFSRRMISGVWGDWSLDVIGITDSISTTSSFLAASASAVKAANDAASDAKADASTALARTAPATTTSRGIGRVATLADMKPGAAVENGPAFLDVKGGVIATTPTAHAVPRADADGSLINWFGRANETDLGLVQLATVAQAQALTNDANALTPKKLANAFGGGNQGLTANGYQKLPGGLIIQWGIVASVAAGEGVGVTFPMAFPTACRCVGLTQVFPSGGTITMNNQTAFVRGSSVSTTGFTAQTGGSGTFSQYWMATGY